MLSAVYVFAPVEQFISFVSALLDVIGTSLGSASNPLFLASCQALGDFASCFALPIRDGSDEDPHVG